MSLTTVGSLETPLRATGRGAGARPAVARGTRSLTGALSLVAALIHFSVAREHFAEWWGYGAFFVVAGLGELAFPVLFARRPAGWVLQAGIWGNLAPILLYMVSRTAGIPLGPDAGAVEDLEVLGITATVAEAGVVLILCTLLTGEAGRRTINALFMVGVGLWLASLNGALTSAPGTAAKHQHGAHGLGPTAQHELRLPVIPDSVRNKPRPKGTG